MLQNCGNFMTEAAVSLVSAVGFFFTGHYT